MRLGRNGLNEATVIKLMRNEMKPSCCRMWRKQVSGRVTKHRKSFIDHVIAAAKCCTAFDEIHITAD
jgi:uncharacterized protein (TIGR03643 family)